MLNAIKIAAIACLTAAALHADEDILPMPAGFPEQELSSIDMEVIRWGMDREFVERQYIAARRYKDMVPVLVALDPRLSECDLRADAGRRFLLWNELDNVVRLRSEGSIRLLREYLGDEDWFLKRMPAPTAWGYE